MDFTLNRPLQLSNAMDILWISVTFLSKSIGVMKGKVNLAWGSFSKKLVSREFVFFVAWMTWVWGLRNVISCRKVDSLKPKQTLTKKLADYKLVTWPISLKLSPQFFCWLTNYVQLLIQNLIFWFLILHTIEFDYTYQEYDI